MRVKFSRALFLSTSGVLLVLLTVGALLSREIIREQIVRNASDNVLQTEEYFRQQLGVRASEISAAVSVLVEDFGFQQALTSNDYDTIVSALINQQARIGADQAVLRLTDGRLVAAGGEAPAGLMPRNVGDLETLVDIAAIEGAAHLVISSPVGSPNPVARITLSFLMGDDFLAQMKNQIGADVTLLVRSKMNDTVVVSTVDMPTSDLERSSYRDALQAMEMDVPQLVAVSERAYMAVPMTLQASDGVQVYLQLPMDSESDPFKRLSLRLGMLVLGGFMLVLLVSSWLARRLTRPLRDLSGLATRIESGDYRVNLPQQSFVEFVRLGQAFDSMQKAIADRESRIFQQARSDVLTGLPNRLAAEECIEKLLQGGASKPFALISIDIDRLREINDSLGADAGDDVLCWTGKNLQENTQRDAMVCRLASDDFLLILPRANHTDAMAVIRKLKTSVQKPLRLINNLDVMVNLHMGVALAPQHGDNASLLIQRAEQAMYRARDMRVQSQVFDSDADAARRRRIALTQDIRAAVAQQQIVMEFLPRIDFSKPLEVAAEVKLRWDHPEFGQVTEQEFIRVAEASGMISEINGWLIEQVCKIQSEWLAQKIGVALTVNIFARDLDDASFVTRVIDTSRRFGVHRSMLCLQVSEALASDSLDMARDVIGRLRRQQVRVSINQFGAGKSSLALLHELEVDELCIDGRFVNGMLRNGTDKAIVETIVVLAHRLGLRVTADGVATREMAKVLQAISVDSVQGDSISRSMSVEQFQAWRQSWVQGKRRSGQ